MEHPSLSVRKDDFSIQITSSLSHRFYVRVDTDTSNSHTIVYTDFIIDPEDNLLALSAIELMSSISVAPSHGMKLIFKDIYPNFYKTHDKIELQRRHDQIIDIVNIYSSNHNLSIGASYLKPLNFIFDTVVSLS